MEALLGALRQARRPFRSTDLARPGAPAPHHRGLGSARAGSRPSRPRAHRRGPALPELLRAQHDLIELQANIGCGPKACLAPWAGEQHGRRAGPGGERLQEQQFAEAHEVMRSADLPGLKERDALLLANSWGRVVLNLADADAFGAPLLPFPYFRTMDEVSTDDLWSAATLDRLEIPLVGRRRDDLLLVSAGPWCAALSVVGAMLTGSWVGRELLDELGRATGARIFLHAPDGGWAGAHWATVPPLGPIDSHAF